LHAYEPEDLVLQRKKKVRAISELGFEAYPRAVKLTHSIPEILSARLRWRVKPGAST
jgi:hypothetical protein